MALVEYLTQFLISGAMVALAGLLLFLNPKHRANQAFALLLVLRGMARTTYILGLDAGTLETANAWWSAFPVFVILLPWAALYFLASYPEPRWWPDRPGRRAALLLGPGLLLVALYGLWPTLFWDLSAAASHPSGPEATAMAGPLFVLDTALVAFYAAITFVLLRDAGDADAPRSTSLSLVGVGFGLSAVAGSATLLQLAPSVLWRHGPVMDLVVTAPVVVAIGLLGWTAVLLGRRAAGSHQARERRTARRALLVLPLPAVAAVASAWLSADAAGVAILFGALSVVWNLALPVLVVYGLLRHQLFGIDLKVQWTIKQSTVAAAFISVFFMVSEGAEAFFSEQLGTLFGILAAGGLVFVLAPLQRLAERLSVQAIPTGKEATEMTEDEQAALYEDQLRFAWSDGKVDRRERQRLENLRERLGLPEERAYQLEAELVSDGDPHPGATGERSGDTQA